MQSITTRPTLSSVTVNMPPGVYYVGDPCYLFDDHGDDKPDEWHAFLDNMYRNKYRTRPECYAGKHKGRPFFVSCTQRGGGSYRDQEQNNYAVDAGLLAVVFLGPLGAEDIPTLPDCAKRGGHQRVFADTFECESVNDDGVVRFGDVRIYTDGHPDDEDE